jgi:hypothetical protein
MSGFESFLKSGHSPTLFAAFFYLMFSFIIWVMNGAMAPFISEQFQLTPAQKGMLLSIPIVAGAIMRFPVGPAGAICRSQNRNPGGTGFDHVHHVFRVLFCAHLQRLVEDGTAFGRSWSQLWCGHVPGLGLVSAQVQRIGHGLGRGRQRWHRISCAAGTPPGAGVWLAIRVWHCRPGISGTYGRGVLHGQGATRPRRTRQL